MSETDKEVLIPTVIDVPKWTQELLTIESEIIKETGSPTPFLIFFTEETPVISVKTPKVEDGNEEDLLRVLFQALMLYPSLYTSTAIFAIPNLLKYEDGLHSSVVIITLVHNSALAEAYPYRIVDDIVQIHHNANYDASFGHPYPLVVGHLMPTMTHTHRRMDHPSKTIEYLESKGFEISFFDGYDMNSIDHLGQTVINAIKKISN